MKNLTLLIGAFALLGLLAAGCGSGDDAAALTKAEFIKQGDAICEKTETKQQAGFLAYSKNHPEGLSAKAAQEELIVRAALPPIQMEAEELAELSAPSGDEEKAEAIVEGIEKALAKTRDDPSKALEGENMFDGVNKLTREYGFKVCSDVS